MLFQDSYSTVPDNVCFVKNCELLESREGGRSKGVYRWVEGGVARWNALSLSHD